MTHAPTLQRLLTLMCVLLLIVRVAGPHLHLCFDGQEAPASVHFLDVGLHHTASHGAPHRDTDVSLAVDGVSKTGKQISFDDLPIVLLAACWSGFSSRLRAGSFSPCCRHSFRQAPPSCGRPCADLPS